MFNLQQELWSVEEEEEEEEEDEEERFSLESLPEDSSADSPEDSSAESEESYCEGCQECGRESQDPPTHHPLQRHPFEHRRCRRRLFAPYDLQDKGRSLCCAGRRGDSGAVVRPWESGSPSWYPPLGSWVRDIGAICQNNWHLQQASSSRTLSHPSFQPFFAAGPTSNGSCSPSLGDQMGSQPSGSPLPLVDCSGFFYTDPTLPPGYRIYNCPSASSQEILRNLPLNTPAPIMCSQPAASVGCRWLTDRECGAVSALLALAPSSCPAPESVESGQTGNPPLSQ